MGLYFWAGWFIWAVLLRLSGMRHPAVTEWPQITSSRRWLSILALLMLALTITPAPLANNSLFELIRGH
jgi:hypothetical protein